MSKKPTAGGSSIKAVKKPIDHKVPWYGMNLRAAYRTLRLTVAPAKKIKKSTQFLSTSDADGNQYYKLARMLEAHGKLRSDSEYFYFTESQTVIKG